MEGAGSAFDIFKNIPCNHIRPFCFVMTAGVRSAVELVILLYGEILQEMAMQTVKELLM